MHTTRTLTFAGLLAGLLSQPLAAQDEAPSYQTSQLSDSVWMVRSRGGNVGVSTGEDGTFIIDDQFAPTAEHLLAAIQGISDAPIRFVINTHYHGDHTGGNEVMGDAGAVIVGHHNLRRRMSSDEFNHFWGQAHEPASEDALPVITFTEQISFHINGEEARVYHVPGGHTDGDSIIHFTGSNVIHMGDIYFNGLYPFIDLDGGGNVKGVISAADKALALANDETKIIPGHGPLATPAELKSYRDMLAAMSERIQALIDEGKSLAEIVAANPTSEYDDPLGTVWITPEQLTVFIHNSLKGVTQYTPLEADDN